MLNYLAMKRYRILRSCKNVVCEAGTAGCLSTFCAVDDNIIHSLNLLTFLWTYH